MITRSSITVFVLALVFAAQGLAACAHQQLGGLLVTFSPYLLTLGVWCCVLVGMREDERA